MAPSVFSSWIRFRLRVGDAVGDSLGQLTLDDGPKVVLRAPLEKLPSGLRLERSGKSCVGGTCQ
jgi:hypothetical protein